MKVSRAPLARVVRLSPTRPAATKSRPQRIGHKMETLSVRHHWCSTSAPSYVVLGAFKLPWSYITNRPPDTTTGFRTGWAAGPSNTLSSPPAAPSHDFLSVLYDWQPWGVGQSTEVSRAMCQKCGCLLRLSTSTPDLPPHSPAHPPHSLCSGVMSGKRWLIEYAATALA